jgi:hypothetical protein
MAIMRMRGFISSSLPDGVSAKGIAGRYYRCMKEQVQSNHPQEMEAGKSEPETGTPAPASPVSDRRGIALPAKALVGGIITPQ